MNELRAMDIHVLPLEWGGQGCSAPAGGSLQEAAGRAERTQGEELGGPGPVRALSFLQCDLGSALASLCLRRKWRSLSRLWQPHVIVRLK